MDWEQRLANLWGSMDQHTEQEFLARMDQLVAELPPNNAIGLFEKASARDSMGHSDLAVPLYREALKFGLPAGRRRQAVIQLASSLRNMGQAVESVALLSAEKNMPSDNLDDTVHAFLALALVDVGREREAVYISLTALSRHMTRYRRSLANYASEVSNNT
jgi:tetratricopeptide (TPR) repeat protein